MKHAPSRDPMLPIKYLFAISKFRMFDLFANFYNIVIFYNNVNVLYRNICSNLV